MLKLVSKRNLELPVVGLFGVFSVVARVVLRCLQREQVTGSFQGVKKNLNDLFIFRNCTECFSPAMNRRLGPETAGRGSSSPTTPGCTRSSGRRGRTDEWNVLTGGEGRNE